MLLTDRTELNEYAGLTLHLTARQNNAISRAIAAAVSLHGRDDFDAFQYGVARNLTETASNFNGYDISDVFTLALLRAYNVN